ncbi:hypothetical protein [Lewinella sp. LCG006]|uniref:hypothetical protein n=1 Tax=Lewinella sp. LCG006 TaxID=3231911 RepID=UPI003460CCA4
MANRNTNRYHIKCGNKILHRGITNDLERRHKEHRQRYGGDVIIVKIGPKVSRESALRWEREGGRRV